jgi:hypothetical protein
MKGREVRGRILLLGAWRRPRWLLIRVFVPALLGDQLNQQQEVLVFERHRELSARGPHGAEVLGKLLGQAAILGAEFLKGFVHANAPM